MSSDSAAGAMIAAKAPCSAAGPEQHGRVHGQTTQRGGGRKADQADDEHALATQVVRQAAAEEEEAGEGEGVGRQHPLPVGGGDVQRTLGRGQGDDDDGAVQHHHQLGDGDDHQGTEPLRVERGRLLRFRAFEVERGRHGGLLVCRVDAPGAGSRSSRFAHPFAIQSEGWFQLDYTERKLRLSMGEEDFMRPKPATDVPCADDLCGDESRPLRADAQRNRARLLEAAEAVFAAEGISVPVDLIAEKAGVGVGTLYRHFPTKEKLFEAILIGRIDGIADDARARIESDDPGAAFFAFLAHLVEESTSKRDLIQALLGAGVEIELAVAPSKRNLEEAVSQLVDAAQRAGAVRSDVSSTVVLSLVGATCVAADHPQTAGLPEAILTIVCDGLRPQPASTPGGPAA